MEVFNVTDSEVEALIDKAKTLVSKMLSEDIDYSQHLVQITHVDILTKIIVDNFLKDHKGDEYTLTIGKLSLRVFIKRMKNTSGKITEDVSGYMFSSEIIA